MKVSNTLRFEGAKDFALQQTRWFDKPLIIANGQILSGERYFPVITINDKSKDQKRYLVGRIVNKEYKEHWMNNWEPITARGGEGPFLEIAKSDLINYE